MPKSTRALALPPPFLAAGVSLSAALGLFSWAMGPRLAAELAYGPICSGHAATALHCPPCYAAAALVGLAAGLVGWGLARLGNRS